MNTSHDSGVVPPDDDDVVSLKHSGGGDCTIDSDKMTNPALPLMMLNNLAYQLRKHWGTRH